MASCRNRKSGVALVIVLGLVAVLVVVCVAFSINMRVERAGAANLRHASMARHLAKGAMAAAIAAIDSNVGDEIIPKWYNASDPSAKTYSSGSGTYWRDTLASHDFQGEGVPARFFTPEVESYFPPGLAFMGYATRYKGASIKEPQWIGVYDTYSAQTNRNLLGRYAYFVLNTTDLIDINIAGRTDRWMGEDRGEIQITPEVFKEEIIDADALIGKVKADGGYESFAEFGMRNSSGAIKDCRSFNVFSYNPTDTNKVFIGKKAGESDDAYVARLKGDKAKIIEAFCDAGLLSGRVFNRKGNKIVDCEQARWAYLGLIDFVDADDEMENDDEIAPYERPATENMPLLSGFIAKLTLECRQKYDEDDDEYSSDTFEIRAKAEFRIPFVYPFEIGTDSPNPSDLKMSGLARIDIDADNYGKKSPFKAFAQKIQKSKTAKGSINWKKKNTLSITGCDAESDWADIEVDDEETPPSLEDLEIMLKVAGCTERGNKLQHRYPISDDGYDEPESWMTVLVNFDDEGIAFPAKFTEKDPKTKAKLWRTEGIIAWADFVDPRFASLDMANANESNQDYPFWTDQLPYYRASHLGSEMNKNKHYGIPSNMLKTQSSTKAYFSGCTAIKDNAEMLADFDDDPDDPDIFGGYFDGAKARNFGSRAPSGASPLVSYILRNPSIARGLFKMNMDGSRLAGGENDATTDSTENKWRMYVKNAPLESVGELGYLPIGPWQTIRLYDYDDDGMGDAKASDPWGRFTLFNRLPCDLKTDHDGKQINVADYKFDGDMAYHPVLDVFTIADPDISQTGYINLNSFNDKILASAFHVLPVGTEENSSLTEAKECYVDNSSHKSDALDIVAPAIIQLHKDNGDFTRLSDMGKLFTIGLQQGAGSHLNGSGKSDFAKVASNAAGDKTDTPGNMGEFEREAMIRNSCGLFTTRGQTFIIVARGESYSPLFGKTAVEGGRVNASKTAIAQIWRDTEKDADGKHPIAIQFFKIIDD